MKDGALAINRTCHVLYSKPCKKQIRSKIALHYPEEQREKVWEQVQKRYESCLANFRTDLGGKKNFHNGTGGTYDCIALMCYYTVCKSVTSLAEIESMEGELFLPAFNRLKFVNCNRPFWQKLLHTAFCSAEKRCDKYGDYKMAVAPYKKGEPIYYEFTACPVAEFAKAHNLTEVMPAFCNPDYKGMALMHGRLVRKTTCSNGDKCDYTVCGDNSEYLADHTEYIDAQGYIRNR